MKQVTINLVSEELYNAITMYGDTTEYVNKKADLADAFGFVSSHMVRDLEDLDKWYLLISLLTEYQEVIDLYHNEARGR